jgi:predicted dehydrogenase
MVASLAVVGAGWRALYFLRIARTLPGWFHVGGIVVRDVARAKEMEALWGIPAHPSLQALLEADRPDFLVLAVSRTAAPRLLAEAATARVPVLTETPPAADLAGLHQVWELVAAGARIQVAEQYLFHPWHAARLALVRSGRLGEISQVQLSIAHDYHGMSLLRLLLGVRFTPACISARSFTAPLTLGPSRQGPPQEHRVVESPQVIAQLDFGGKLGIHDFAAGQYRSWIRAPRLLVRGERGEIKDKDVRFLKDFRTPVALELRRMDTGQSGGPEHYCHEGVLAGDEWLYKNPFLGTSLSDDEIAGATSLQKMADHVAGGPGPYPFAEAAQDQYLALCIAEALATGTVVTTERQPWTDQGVRPS